MFKNVRLIIGLSLLGGIPLTAVVGWATGFLAEITAVTAGLWNGFTIWLDLPLSWEHLLISGPVLIMLIVLVVIFALADG